MTNTTPQKEQATVGEAKVLTPEEIKKIHDEIVDGHGDVEDEFQDAAEEEDSGLSGGAIAGIIAGGVVVAGGIAYAAMQAQGGRRERLGGAPQYSAVRRSERFSTMNF